MKEISIGYDDFKDLIESNGYYVDKSKVIEELLTKNSKVVLFPRPRRFGKSLFISMLENFLDIDKKDDNKELFKGLYIEKSDCYKYFGEYPVIKLDFKELKEEKYDEFYDKFKILISKVFKQKEYVMSVLDETELKIFNDIRNMESSISIYKESIRFLSEWLYRYHKKQVIILIDEYDAPISNAYLTNIYEEVLSLIKGVMSASLKGNNCLKLGVLTGVLRVSRESMFSDLNNVDIYDIMHKGYSEYFGFTENETKELLEYYNLELTDVVKGYYDGYNFGGRAIYNPWSILNYAKKKELISYWVNTGENLLIKKCLNDISYKDKILIERLILGESITFTYNDRLTYADFDKTSDLGVVLNLLLVSGYLTLDKTIEDEGTYYHYFKIPNKEVKEELIKIIKNITLDEDNDNYIEFKKYLLNDDKESVEKYLNNILVNMSYHDKKEAFYHGYMLGLFTGFLNDYYKVRSNRESGEERYDLLIEKKDLSVGLVLEFKITEDESLMESLANKGLEQIDSKDYTEELVSDKVKKIYKNDYLLLIYLTKYIHFSKSLLIFA